MTQCMQTADQMTIRSSMQKRRHSDDHGEPFPKRRVSAQGQLESSVASVAASAANPSTTPSTTPHKPILPRPSSNVIEQVPQPQLLSPAPGPRKRGRPPRSDRSKLLRPMLPQIAPRPAEQISTPSSSQTPQPTVSSYSGPVPSTVQHMARSLQAPHPNELPDVTATYRTSLGPLELKRMPQQALQKPDEVHTQAHKRPDNVDPSLSRLSTPRVMPEDPPKHLGRTLPTLSQNPVPLEPSIETPSASRVPQESSSVSLPPLLERPAHMASVDPPYNENQAPLASSA